MSLQNIKGYTPITRKSIESVKCTRIITGDGSEKYNKYIQYLAKKVLNISLTRTDGYINDEVGILARLDGTYESQPIYGYWNEDLQTSVIDSNKPDYIEAIEYNINRADLVFVHNHPNNSIVSLSDLFTLLWSYNIKLIVAVSNNGSINYALKTSNNSKYYYKLYEAIINKINSKKISEQEAYNKLLSKQEVYNLKIWRTHNE